MKQEDQRYIASVKKYDNYYTSIMKDITKKLKNNPNLNINGLIGYLLKNDGFDEEEKELKKALEYEIKGGRKSYNMLLIRINGQNNYEMLDKNENGQIIEKIGLEISKDYFKNNTLDEIKYNALNLELKCCSAPDGERQK